MDSTTERLEAIFYEIWNLVASRLAIPGIPSPIDRILLATLAFVLLLFLLQYAFWFLNRKLSSVVQGAQFKVEVKQVDIVSSDQIALVIARALKIVNYLAILFLIYIYATVLISFYPKFSNIATLLFKSIVRAVVTAADSVISFIPNLIFIIIIVFITRHILKIAGISAAAIARGRLSFPGFHKEWAYPTEKIIKFITVILATILVAPYLPGFDTPAFKGISIFLGIILSLGSTTAVANVVSGLVLIYMRAFDDGDRVRIAQIEGDIEEHGMLITRIRTLQNRVITVPNALILSTPIVNYSTLALDPGVVVHTTVTIGYDVPWRKVHELLESAAINTTSIIKEPAPFVLQKALDDNAVAYEVNAYTNKISDRHQILSELLQNIQDFFMEAKIEILSPRYTAVRDGNNAVIPLQQEPSELLPKAFRFLRLD